MGINTVYRASYSYNVTTCGYIFPLNYSYRAEMNITSITEYRGFNCSVNLSVKMKYIYTILIKQSYDTLANIWCTSESMAIQNNIAT